VPAALSAIVERMLAKAPPDRFPDLRAVSQALAEVPRGPASALREGLARLIPAAAADALSAGREGAPRSTPGHSVPAVGQAYLRRTPASNEGIVPDPKAEGPRAPVDPGARTAAFVAGVGATAARAAGGAAATGMRPVAAYTPPAPSAAPARAPAAGAAPDVASPGRGVATWHQAASAPALARGALRGRRGGGRARRRGAGAARRR
jgi:hypothetical protein